MVVMRLQQNAESSYTAFIVIHRLGKRDKILFFRDEYITLLEPLC